MAGVQLLSRDRDRTGSGEAGKAVKGVDALPGEILFLMLGHPVGEAPLEGHQLAPVDPRLAHDTMAAHARRGVDRLRTADQHLLRIAAAERAGAPERPVVDD